jgi:dUTP pyrophosphatase
MEKEFPRMNAHINLQGTSIKFERDEIDVGDGAYALLADIAESVSIPPGRFAMIDTPIWAKGDGATIAIINVQAGNPDSAVASGQYLIPSQENSDRIVALLANRTTSTIVINPKNRIGFVEFTLIGGGEQPEQADAADVTDVATGGTTVPTAQGIEVPAVYAPQHIDAEDHPFYATEGSAAFDLRADQPGDIVLQPGHRALIDTGLRLAIPLGYEGQIRPRSGLAAKHGIGITNSPATIDADYRGEIKVVLQNHGQEPFTVAKGDRIAQMLITPVMRAALDFRTDLDDTVRGVGGFGSTGRA